MQLFSIDTGNLRLDGGAMFGVIPKALWNNLYPADESNLINLSMRCLLIVLGDRKILIDNGIGNKQSQKFFSFYSLNGEATLAGSLQKAGYACEDITDVILTHLHFDHCGGGIKRTEDGNGWETTFKNATYWTGKDQWEWATHPNNREKASFLTENIIPIRDSGQLSLIENNRTLFAGVSVRLFNGHTEGQLIPFIDYQEKTIVYCGDLIPTSAHIPVPYIMGYDIRPLISMKEKEDFLKEAVDKGYVLFFEHDVNHECSFVGLTERGYRNTKTFRLSECV
ncbi:MAG: MBL fold metallo-hydrolase [Bacteroidetes bacterium]|nr:MBL fold metallo-hydrolase [Bacteroidota bacterium]